MVATSVPTSFPFHITLMRRSDLLNLSDGDFAVLLKEVGKRLKDHPAFQDAPSCVPNSQTFDDTGDLLVEMISACMRDKSKEPEKNAVRKRGHQSIDFALQFANMYSVHHNDPSAREIFGPEVKEKKYNKDARKVPPGKLEKLEINEVLDGKGGETDRLLFVIAKIPDKGSVEIQYTDNPNDPASWKTFCHLHECRSFAEKGELQRVKKYYFRGRFDTAGGKGPWSETVKHVIL